MLWCIVERFIEQRHGCRDAKISMSRNSWELIATMTTVQRARINFVSRRKQCNKSSFSEGISFVYYRTKLIESTVPLGRCDAAIQIRSRKVHVIVCHFAVWSHPKASYWTEQTSLRRSKHGECDKTKSVRCCSTLFVLARSLFSAVRCTSWFCRSCFERQPFLEWSPNTFGENGKRVPCWNGYMCGRICFETLAKMMFHYTIDHHSLISSRFWPLP